jgi:hypothetical protein
MTMRELRAVMQSYYGARKYRIHRDGRVFVHGIVPGTNLLRWYLLGRLNADNLVVRAA